MLAAVDWTNVIEVAAGVLLAGVGAVLLYGLIALVIAYIGAVLNPP